MGKAINDWTPFIDDEPKKDISVLKTKKVEMLRDSPMYEADYIVSENKIDLKTKPWVRKDKAGNKVVNHIDHFHAPERNGDMHDYNQSVVYILCDQEYTPLYVGITDKLAARMSQHRNSKSWWDEVKNIIVYPVDKEFKNEIERETIEWLNPPYNKAHTEKTKEQFDAPNFLMVGNISYRFFVELKKQNKDTFMKPFLIEPTRKLAQKQLKKNHKIATTVEPVLGYRNGRWTWKYDTVKAPHPIKRGDDYWFDKREEHRLPKGIIVHDYTKEIREDGVYRIKPDSPWVEYRYKIIDIRLDYYFKSPTSKLSAQLPKKYYEGLGSLELKEMVEKKTISYYIKHHLHPMHYADYLNDYLWNFERIADEHISLRMKLTEKSGFKDTKGQQWRKLLSSYI